MVDTAAVGTLPSPLPPPFQGAFRELGAIDQALIERIFDYEGIYDRSTQRIEVFLAVTGGGAIALEQRQVVGRYEEEGMTFTEG